MPCVLIVGEGSLLYPLSQKHLLTLLATTWDGSSPMLLYPYTEPGNLKRYLASCHQPISTHQVRFLGGGSVLCTVWYRYLLSVGGGGNVIKKAPGDNWLPVTALSLQVNLL